MLVFLGFIGIFLLTVMVRDVYKYFVMVCIGLGAIGLLLKVDFLFTILFTVLFGSFICLILIGGSSSGYIPGRGVSMSDLSDPK